MKEDQSSQNQKKRSGSPSPIATIRVTEGAAAAAATAVGVVAAKRRMATGGGVTPTTTSTWAITPIPILILIFKYLDQYGLMKASTLSKQCHRIIHTNPGMAQHRIVPVLELSASKNKGDEGRSLRLTRFLLANVNKLQRYRVLKLLDVNKFDEPEFLDAAEFYEHQPFILDGIVSFNFSSLFQLSNVHCWVVDQLLFMLPNLREINLTNIGGEGFDKVLDRLLAGAPQLERITWNNIDSSSNIYIDGTDMTEATNLREIIMDGSIFSCGKIETIETMSDLENRPRIFLFCFLESQVLERISIRRAKVRVYDQQTYTTVPQNALIKFIRNAPRSLRSFRSDLSKENIKLLQLERPGIEFLN